MRRTLWVPEKERREWTEIASSADYRAKFIDILADNIVEALRVGWNDNKAFKSLLISVLEDDVMDLLGQYLHSQLEIVGGSFNRAFGTEAEIEPGYAAHAKMNNFIEAIMERHCGAAGKFAR